MKSPLGRLESAVGPTYQDKLAALIIQEKPNIVVETGLWNGFGAEYILQALDANDKGHLYSIDPMDPEHESNGCKGRPDLYLNNPIDHPRFTFIRKYSHEALGPLFDEVGPFDVFIHDSDHSSACQEFEFEAAWKFVRSGGIIASDDVVWGIPPHRAWWKFLARHGLGSNGNVIGTAQWIRKP